MSQPLIRELAARLQVDEARAASLLHSFVEQLRRHVDGGSDAVIPGIGRFSKAGDGISFEPDPALSTAVNFRYAGLEPIEIESQELPAAFEAPPAPPPAVDDPTEAPVDADDWLESAGMESEEERFDEAPAVWEEERDVEEAASAPEQFAPPVQRTEFDADEDFADESEPEVVEIGDTSMPAPRSGSDEPDRVERTGRPDLAQDPQPLRPPARRAASAPDDGDEERRRPKPWLIAAIIVVMAGAAGLFVIQQDTSPDEVTFTFDNPPASQQPGPTQADAPPPTVEDAADAELDEPVDEPAAEEPDVASAEPAATPTPPESPLRGEGIDRSVSRYTLVVGSLQSAAVADEVAEEWRNRGFRTDIFSETANGVTRYRVGIGQFETINAADAARSGEIASQLPEGTWVYRYPARSSE